MLPIIFGIIDGSNVSLHSVWRKRLMNPFGWLRQKAMSETLGGVADAFEVLSAGEGGEGMTEAVKAFKDRLSKALPALPAPPAAEESEAMEGSDPPAAGRKRRSAKPAPEALPAPE